jgi:hypothetical protein
MAGENFVNIEGKEIKRIEYKNQPVITFRMIDELHERPEGTARKAFHRHRDKFVENEDFFDVPYEECSKILCVHNMDAQTNRHDFIRVITESGYLMIVKPFNDERAWKIQRALVRHYLIDLIPTLCVGTSGVLK